jgi:hypothetical protein
LKEGQAAVPAQADLPHLGWWQSITPLRLPLENRSKGLPGGLGEGLKTLLPAGVHPYVECMKSHTKLSEPPPAVDPQPGRA